MAESGANVEPIAEADKASSEKPKLSGGILVSSRQKGNPILKFVRNVPWEFTDSIVPGTEISVAWEVPKSHLVQGFPFLFLTCQLLPFGRKRSFPFFT